MYLLLLTLLNYSCSVFSSKLRHIFLGLFFFCFSFFFPLCSDKIKMSAAQEVASILAGAAPKTNKDITYCLKLTKFEVEKFIKASG